MVRANDERLLNDVVLPQGRTIDTTGDGQVAADQIFAEPTLVLIPPLQPFELVVARLPYQPVVHATTTDQRRLTTVSALALGHYRSRYTQ